jgi:hypothetical protein
VQANAAGAATIKPASMLIVRATLSIKRFIYRSS